MKIKAQSYTNSFHKTNSLGNSFATSRHSRTRQASGKALFPCQLVHLSTKRAIESNTFQPDS